VLARIKGGIKMSKSKLSKHTKSYHDDLIEALRDPKESYAYLQVAIDEYQEDNDADALLVALRNVAEARVVLLN
jgi:hypothetical protein